MDESAWPTTFFSRQKRTNKPTDYLFAWRGVPFTRHMLKKYIEKLCELAKTDQRYTSHRFRHTLATLANGGGNTDRVD
ncbi:MAG: tyrosine-type recombinase/integrase [Acidobacteria bacterium]|nr:tyrosine-type recombinase/integrase [Acidobacteriota bacterium]